MSFGKRTSKHDLVVDIKRQSLKVVHKNQVCLDGELGHSVSVESSTWTLSDGKLEIILTKTDRSIPWDDLIVNDPRGQKVMDAETANEWHHRLLHLSSEEIVKMYKIVLLKPGFQPIYFAKFSHQLILVVLQLSIVSSLRSVMMYQWMIRISCDLMEKRMNFLIK